MAAIDLLSGVRPSVVARKYGVTRTTTSRWKAQVEAGVSLRRRQATGRPGRLTEDQLVEVWAAGARVAGFDSRRWTCYRFAAALFDRYGVRFHPDHAGRILHRLNRGGL